MWTLLRSVANITAISVGVPALIVHDIGTLAKIEGDSMQPTFNPENGVSIELCENSISEQDKIKLLNQRLKQDRVFVNKWSVKEKKKLEIGDIVVFISPQDPNRRHIKRILAMPGDVIQIIETGDIFYIEPGHCWLEGDNNSSSYDSSDYGPVPLGLIEGRVSFIVWPLNRIQRITNDCSKSFLSKRTKLLT